MFPVLLIEPEYFLLVIIIFFNIAWITGKIINAKILKIFTTVDIAIGYLWWKKTYRMLPHWFD